jgi:hypothetical protein
MHGHMNVELVCELMCCSFLFENLYSVMQYNWILEQLVRLIQVC